MGLKAGSEYFFLASATQTLFMILLNTFWTVIWFGGLYQNKRQHIIYVVATHMFVSCLTLLNKYHLYSLTLTCSGIVTIITAFFAYSVAGGSLEKLKSFFKCQQ
jgi:anterior pharynx defective protein 1